MTKDRLAEQGKTIDENGNVVDINLETATAEGEIPESVQKVDTMMKGFGMGSLGNMIDNVATRFKTIRVNPKEYYKNSVLVKNPKIAANIEMMHNKYLEMRANHKPHVKKEADPLSVQSRKIQLRLANPVKKITSHMVRTAFNMEKKLA